MQASNAGFNLFIAETEIPDPGNAGTIGVQASLATCNLVSAGAETRTLPLPVKEGVVISLFAQTLVGTITLTVTGGLDLAGTTTFAFTAVNQFLSLESFRKADGTCIWLKIADYTQGAGGASFTNANISGQLTFASNANIAASATGGTMIATNANQLIALWGGTPVARPAVAGVLLGMNGNGATNANAVNMNSNGNIGATYMNFSDVVATLKKMGAAPA